MKITAIVENTSGKRGIKTKHGLSLLVEGERFGQILFDTGPDSRLLFSNAEKLGLDLRQIETVVLSHGHIDHGGALHDFLKQNKQATVFLRREALAEHITKMAGISIPVSVLLTERDVPRLIFTQKVHKLAPDAFLLSEIEPVTDRTANRALYQRMQNDFVPDSFVHEQSLLICRQDKTVLIAGCAHCGIENIIEAAQQFIGREIDVVVSGFHLYNPVTHRGEKREVIERFGQRLSQFSCRYITFHCTGKRAYKLLKRQLGDRISYLPAGQSIII